MPFTFMHGLLLSWTPSSSLLTQVWVVFTLAMTGKFLIAAAFAIAYLFTAELFPTPVR
jgi:hypothetical protein